MRRSNLDETPSGHGPRPRNPSPGRLNRTTSASYNNRRSKGHALYSVQQERLLHKRDRRPPRNHAGSGIPDRRKNGPERTADPRSRRDRPPLGPHHALSGRNGTPSADHSVLPIHHAESAGGRPSWTKSKSLRKFSIT